jgi:hypothetical protein
MRNYIFLLPLLAVGCGSAGGAAQEDESSEDALTTAACAGAACPTLSQPVPLLRGGLATVGDELYWIAAGTAKDAYGQPIDELQHCALPSCSTIARLPLAAAGAEPFEAYHLESAGTGVIFEATPSGSYSSSLYASDGSSFHEIYSGLSGQHDKHAVDANGLFVYQQDRRTDGWARSSLSYCAFNGLDLKKPCVGFADASLNSLGAIALTPTHAVIVHSMSVVSLDRATLKGNTVENVWANEGSTQTATIGDFVFGLGFEVNERGGQVFHDTTLFRGPDEAFGGRLDGVFDSFTSNGSRGYVTTRGEGDVWERPSSGVVARINPTAKVRFTRNLATQQDGYALALSSTDVYWLNRTSAPGAATQVAVVRHTKK